MGKPIRILQVLGRLNRGGAESMIMNLYRKIDRSKVQFDFIVHTNEKCAFDDEVYELGGKIFRVPAYKGKNHFSYKNSWKMFFESHPDYKIIHGHIRSTASIYLKIAKKNGLITLVHSHSTSSGIGFPAIVKTLLQYPVRHIADYFFACSKPAGEWLFGKNACQKENFYILNNAIDVKKFMFDKDTRMKKRKELQIENKFVLGHVGRFDKAKNQDFLVEIFKTVHDKNNNSVLILVGDGVLKCSIEKKVYDLGLNESVIFTGIRSDISDLMQVMDVFVFPSLYEGFPVTLVEAQAVGLPCLVSDNITDEVKITDLVTFISMDLPAKQWAEKAFLYLNTPERKNTNLQFINDSYDIETTANWLQNFYIGLMQ